MAIDFKAITLDIIDIASRTDANMYINKDYITFNKGVIEELNYSAYVQFGVDKDNLVFAIRACKGTESRAMPFSKPRPEQLTPISIRNKVIYDVVCHLIDDYNPDNRYKVTGYYDNQSRTVFFDMSETIVTDYVWIKKKK